MFAKLKQSAESLMELVHIVIATVYTVVAMGLIGLLARLLFTLLFPFVYLGDRTGYDALVSRFPMRFLLGGVALVAFFAAQGWFPFGSALPQILAGSALWLFALHTVTVAYAAASDAPPRFDQYEATIDSRWPDRWYARHMKKPLNAIYVRRIVVNSLMLIPAAAAIVIPGTISPYSVAFFFMASIMTGMAHESVDHSDMHNNLFARHHLRGGVRWAFWLTNRYLRLVLNPASLRIPHFYRAQHIYIHHVENSGVRDIQTTVRHDRTSFFDFARYAFTLGLSWSFAIDVYRYLHAQKNFRQCRLLILGLASWFGALALIALHNPAAALFFFGFRFLSGVGIAQGIYFWHALADPNDPDNIYTNTVNLVPQGLATLETAELHVLHHERSSVHFTRLITIDHEKHEHWRKRGVISLSSATADSGLFLKALLVRRFDVIADFVVCADDVKKEDLMSIIEHRTRPTVEKKRNGMYRRLDRLCARIAAAYLIPGGLPGGPASPT